jgi:hypothetical protein
VANAAFAVPHFLGGEISAFAQGRFDKPDYRNSLRTCFNAFPTEIGAWTRRPGSQFGQTTRGGAPGRNIKFDFQQSAAVTFELTDGFMRFRSGARLLTTNDAVNTLAISAANPAVMQLPSASPWVTGNTVQFTAPATAPALLENRQFVATRIDSTHFSLTDSITGAGIDGSATGTAVTSVSRIQELATPYVAGSWAPIRAVQAETTDILLSPTVAPQALTVTTQPAPGVDPQFALAPATFNDGPYLDPFTNGVQATPNAKSGIISLTLGFPAYDATKAYAVGSFVTSVGINYISLQDQNVGNTPAGAPTFWGATTAGAAINNGQGFLGTDTGRLVRLLSEPPLWLVGSTYAIGTAVTYNPSGIPGASTYWQSLTSSNVGHAPGSDLTNWQIIPQGAAIWTWGKITGLSNVIDRALAGSVAFGNMTVNGGVAAAFNGAFSQSVSPSSVLSFFGGFTFANTPITFSSYVGKNYSGASAQKIQRATVYPTSDEGFAFGNSATFTGTNVPMQVLLGMTFNLRAKATAPAAASDGTLLGTTGALGYIPNAAINITSNDQVTTWNYVWIELIVPAQVTGAGGGSASSYNFNNCIAQVSFFSPTGTGTSSGANVEILGAPLLYTNSILTWRLGVYSNTTGWPTCGVYNDGRLFLGGAVGNRFDACVSNGIVGSTINFAPTDQYGVVAASSAISYVFNSNGVNPILWMDPDLQGVKMGTQAGEWLVVAPTAGSIAPNNISARNVTGHGGANIQPCRTEHTTIFVQRFAQKLLEYFPDVYSGKFSAPNLADKAQHLTSKGVAELAYTSAVNPIIWGRDTVGALFGITYKRDSLASAQPPSFYAWHHHALGSGRVVESVCAGPSVGGNLDTLTLVTNDPATGIRHVEVLTDAQDELAPLANAWFLDDAVTPTSTVSTGVPSVGAPQGGLTLNGLWHLNGKTVQVFAGGLDCGDPGEGLALVDFVVTNGSTFVPFGDGISSGPGRGLFTAAFVAANPQIVAGFTYNSDGQLMHMIAQADTGARNGPAFGVLSRAHRFAAKFVNSFGLSFGTDLTRSSAMVPVIFKTDAADPIPPLTTFTGLHQDSALDDYAYDNAFCWRVSRPWPATVVAIGNNLATQDQ